MMTPYFTMGLIFLLRVIRIVTGTGKMKSQPRIHSQILLFPGCCCALGCGGGGGGGDISAADYKHPVSAFSPLPRLPAVFLFRTGIPTLPHCHNGCDAHHPASGALFRSVRRIPVICRHRSAAVLRNWGMSYSPISYWPPVKLLPSVVEFLQDMK